MGRRRSLRQAYGGRHQCVLRPVKQSDHGAQRLMSGWHCRIPPFRCKSFEPKSLGFRSSLQPGEDWTEGATSVWQLGLT